MTYLEPTLHSFHIKFLYEIVLKVQYCLKNNQDLIKRFVCDI